MKKHGPKRILETKYLYCNKHGDCEHVFSDGKIKRWKCCACTVDSSAKHTRMAKIKSVEYKGGCCEICGYSSCIAALTFHHVDPLFKSFNLSGTNLKKSWNTLVLELDKCRLLCSNCHIELHDKEDKDRIEKNKKPVTQYHKKIIHQINSKKLGKKPSL